jgi:hypothetical protein
LFQVFKKFYYLKILKIKMTFHLALVALVLTIPEVEFDYFFGEKKHVHDFNFLGDDSSQSLKDSSDDDAMDVMYDCNEIDEWLVQIQMIDESDDDKENHCLIRWRECLDQDVLS